MMNVLRKAGYLKIALVGLNASRAPDENGTAPASTPSSWAQAILPPKERTGWHRWGIAALIVVGIHVTISSLIL